MRTRPFSHAVTTYLPSALNRAESTALPCGNDGNAGSPALMVRCSARDGSLPQNPCQNRTMPSRLAVRRSRSSGLKVANYQESRPHMHTNRLQSNHRFGNRRSAPRQTKLQVPSSCNELLHPKRFAIEPFESGHHCIMAGNLHQQRNLCSVVLKSDRNNCYNTFCQTSYIIRRMSASPLRFDKWMCKQRIRSQRLDGR